METCCHAVRYERRVGRMSFATELQSVRSRKRLSQSQAAAVIPGLSVRALQEWEADRKAPPVWAQGLILAKLRASHARRKT